jgi:hypothetical protein
MEWCLECHRDPARFLRPPERVFDVDWTPPVPQRELGEQLLLRHHVEARTTCSACHR